MTDHIAIGLGILIAALIGGDFVLTGGDNLLFVAKKFADMLEWLAFWR
ncbi:hypothetical protein TG4357_00194 [Thalassovita gelatinovora]|uniref:Glyceraldehyde-3-phosphate dehydrogenase n=1 Tax=Thalassovita gelatinovora TaxID=53501 RepID=A0A0P1F4I8_THAGE|nr:hypothetical protein [Thalassovita gelatinovora]QIZ79332.1 hypothetical protein HFZ77_02015 [Thalassovita gelatinovora]CUH62589.1 hypothetical protein TG4357_00194 [Thalassovita gelatinovora]SEQ06954.1 hypothetical protein SAMN04488043_10394 [Thalassovita gelatinovora]